MQRDMALLKKVFIHEMGHYVAQELNHELYGIGRVSSIEFIRETSGEKIDYIGKTVSEKGISVNDDNKLINLPERIAELVYGCYFQSIYLDFTLEHCLDINNKSANGHKDAWDIASGLKQFNVKNERQALYSFLHKEYFDDLKNYKSDLKSLFQFDVKEFLLATENGFTTDLNKVYKITSNFRKLHKEDFKGFVEKIKEIIKWQNQ